MSGHHQSAARKDKRRGGVAGRLGGETRDTQGNGDREVYIQSVTDVQVARLTGKGNNRLVKEIIRRSGADVQFHQSHLPNIATAIIRGHRSQIETAVKLINEKTDVQDLISDQAQIFWTKWVEAAFPDLESRAYFLPPVYFNRVPMVRQSVGGQDVLVLQSGTKQADQSNLMTSTSAAVHRVQETDIKYDAAFQRLFVCLQKMSEQVKEAFVGISQLEFGQYLGEPCYAAAAAHLPLPKTISNDSLHYKQGDFDVLLIHRSYGLVVCEVKSVGDNLKKLNMSQQDIDNNIRKTLRDAMSQLDKAEAMLSHLVSDIAPGLRITRTIAFPNLTAHQVQQAISGDTQLTQDLCRCLGTTDPDDIAGLSS
ncbi:uncharacterized protein LOC112574715 [Pomacea canaliculata]|uniref:uncharacterized protein LOC112574715 n=1 Tax=Pomacea canaliculata TaxID=400727 RepID=UPI000D727CCA|nr:uncharacterized protein LOC112574715 [Pomacea canaliculata]